MSRIPLLAVSSFSVPRTRDDAARQRVLEAARDLVCERGPRAVSVDQIAAAAGVGKQTIYRWWPSRGAVVMDALIELTDPEPAQLPDSVRDAVRLQMRRVGRMFASRKGELIREVVADTQGDPALAEDFQQRFFAHRRERGAATIARGIANGELRPDLDVEDALDVLYAPLWLRLLVGHRPCNQRAVDDLLDLVWPALANGVAET
jgi:AcrR family transcriptional regulator